MNGRNTSDVHTCLAKSSISWDGTFCPEANHKIEVKLNTGCVQNVVTTWRGGLGRPSLGTDAEDFFSRNRSHSLRLTLTPTWMRSMSPNGHVCSVKIYLTLSKCYFCMGVRTNEHKAGQNDDNI